MDRKVLLPPYMEDIQAWTDLVDIMDTVYKSNIDDPTRWLAQLRFLWLLGETAYDKIAAGQMLDATADFQLPEKEILVRQANQLGFNFKDAGLIRPADYQRIARNIAQYWYEKGKPNFIDFLGFVLNSILTVTNLWSTTGATWDTYGTFLPEGDPGIGTPVWQGGTWFPTTHVEVSFDPFIFVAPSVAKMTELFYVIANYDLVLKNIAMDGIAYIHSVDSQTLGIAAVAYPLILIEAYIFSA